MGQDNQPTEAGLEVPSLKFAARAVKRWAARLGQALVTLGEAVPPTACAAAQGMQPWPVAWRLAPACAGAPVRPALQAVGPGLAIWLDVGADALPRAVRPMACALGLDLRATLWWPGMGTEGLGLRLQAVCALPEVACVVIDARDAEHAVASALKAVAWALGRHPKAHRAPLTVLAHFFPPGVPGGANLPIKWPKLDHLQGMA